MAVAPQWSSTTSVSSGASIAGPLIAPSITNTFAVQTPSIRQDVDFGLVTSQSGLREAARVDFIGTGLDMSDCTPTYTDGSLDTSFWTTANSGSGTATEVSGLRALRLDTGLTGGSVCVIRTSALAADLDVEMRVNSRHADATVQSLFELALYVDANNDLRLVVQQEQVSLRLRVNGQTQPDIALGVTSNNPQLRLLRAGSEVYVFLGGAFVTTVAWSAANCSIELAARNHATAASRALTDVTGYLRRPVILFETAPVQNIQVLTSYSAEGVAPPRSVPGAVDVKLTGCSTTPTTLSSAFTYAREDTLPTVFYIPNGPRLTAVSDPIVSGHVGRG